MLPCPFHATSKVSDQHSKPDGVYTHRLNVPAPFHSTSSLAPQRQTWHSHPLKAHPFLQLPTNPSTTTGLTTPRIFSAMMKTTMACFIGSLGLLRISMILR